MRSSRRAFSLVEVMIVVVIIGLMAGLVTYATTGYLERAKRQRARSDVATYSGAVDAYYIAHGYYPDVRKCAKDWIKVPARSSSTYQYEEGR